jgi:hypothetical protein
MSDDIDTGIDATIEVAETGETRPIAPDSFKTVRDLIALVVDPKQVKRHLRQLHDSLAQVAAAQVKLAADRAVAAAQIEEDRAELAEERDVLMKRRLAVQRQESELAEREQSYLELERAWSGLQLPGAPPPMMTGATLTRSEPFTGLQKAKHFAEYGRLPDHPGKPIEGAPLVEPSPAPLRSGPNDAGDWPANVTLTRTEQAPEPVMIRRHRGAARHAERA